MVLITVVGVRNTGLHIYEVLARVHKCLNMGDFKPSHGHLNRDNDGEC